MSKDYVIYYEHCGRSWVDYWDCACNSECPICGKEVEPVYYEEHKPIEIPIETIEKYGR